MVRSKRAPFGRLAKTAVILAIVSVIFLAKDGSQLSRMHREIVNLRSSSRGLDGIDGGDMNSENGERYPLMKNTLFDNDNVARFLKNGKEIIVPKEDRKADSEIRYAAFGSSATWGAGLENRDQDCYVWQLSNHDQERGKNFAIRATGPSYPAQCLSTMMGEELFDVIILEYYQRSHEGLLPLAKRLRERFPDAIMVFTRLWAPDRMMHKRTLKNLPSWAHDKGFDRNFIHDKSFHDVYLNESGNNWWFWPGSRGQKEIQEAAAEEVGGYLIQMPFNERPDGPGGWLDIGDQLLADDSFHPSAKGHQDIAKRVKQIVDRVGVPKTSRVVPFSTVDHCYNWLQTGVIGEGVQFGPNGSIIKMPNTQKFALEFDFEKSEDGNWMLFENVSNQKMDISVGYMTTGPMPSKYPKVAARIEGKEDEEDIVLDPETSVSYGDKQVHITRVEKIGILEPSSTQKVHFKPLETRVWPFRIVQVMITPRQDGSAIL